MNLIKAEILRFSSRRFIQIMVVMLLVAFGLTIFTVMASTEQPTTEMWANARMQAAETRHYLENEYANCVANLTDTRRCADLDPSKVVVEDYLYGVFHFARQIEALVFFLGAFLSLFGYLVMASFIGSELHSGGMTNLLLWRPNRTQVLGSKLGVGLGMLTAISVVFSLIYIGTFYGIAETMGYAGGMTASGWSHVALITVRGIGMALVAGLVSFAVATVGRHTAAALGALLGYVIVWEGGARLIMEIASRNVGASNDPYFLSTYIAAWFAGEYTYYDYTSHLDNGAMIVYWWQAAVVFGALTAAAAAVAFTGFRRRDLA
ncbi:hypothetical protein Rhe02_26750 [Rhizocola hellebori]|uniref:ABC transporter permease n=1 Tax=Rhizocola hellebori TaxID=1392758 RepID=A0A8J3Q5V7_9ACTN|nr:ABC transporter permease [Rhizocola hellebori]GIH04608.1 hypothetical protein Rhe02_26750 [Rhizocola hellebori]